MDQIERQLSNLNYALFNGFMKENNDDSLKYTNCLLEWSFETINENNILLEDNYFDSFTLEELIKMIKSETMMILTLLL